MEDFASLLVAAREKAGLTQAQLATRAGLTPSYLSFIENRKKPPPSDAVCGRLAKVLGIPARQLIEVAQLERAPTTVKQRVRTLDHRLRRERRSRQRVLESLLSPFLFAGPGFFEAAVDRLGASAARRRRLREVLAALGRRHQDRAGEIARIVDELSERDRRLLLEALPKILSEHDRGARAAGAATTPELFYSLPGPDRTPTIPFLLVWTPAEDAPSAAGAEVRAGDLLLVDPALAPTGGDLVVLRGPDGRAVLRRLERAEGAYRLSLVGAGREPGRGDAAEEPATTLDKAALGALLAKEGVGTVAEIRRPLRRRAT